MEPEPTNPHDYSLSSWSSKAGSMEADEYREWLLFYEDTLQSITDRYLHHIRLAEYAITFLSILVCTLAALLIVKVV